MAQAAMADMLSGSVFKGHTIVSRGPLKSNRGFSAEIAPSALLGLCGPFNDMLNTPVDAERCHACEVMERVFCANMPFAWSRRVPFVKGGLHTLATRFWILSLMKQAEDSTVFSRWQAAGTFEFLQTEMARQPSPEGSFPFPDAAAFPCCHYCGAEAKDAFPGSTCRVCESATLTRPVARIGVVKSPK